MILALLWMGIILLSLFLGGLLVESWFGGG
jgi:hypothetical protein